MNLVILCGEIRSAPRCSQLAGGEFRWSFDVSTASHSGSHRVEVSWHGALPDPGWTEGTRVVVAGQVRRRFYRSGGLTQSRTEVLAASLVEVTGRRSAAVALRQAARVLDPDESARLRSALPSPS